MSTSFSSMWFFPRAWTVPFPGLCCLFSFQKPQEWWAWSMHRVNNVLLLPMHHFWIRDDANALSEQTQWGSVLCVQYYSILYQWEFQDPKMEVLYHIRPYFVVIFPYIGLKNRPNIYGIGTSFINRFLLHGHWYYSNPHSMMSNSISRMDFDISIDGCFLHGFLHPGFQLFGEADMATDSHK